MAKERFPVAAIYGTKWCGSTVCFHCDNMAVVNRQAAKDPLICHQLEFVLHLCVVDRHTPGMATVGGDPISKNNIPLSL